MATAEDKKQEAIKAVKALAADVECESESLILMLEEVAETIEELVEDIQSHMFEDDDDDDDDEEIDF